MTFKDTPLSDVALILTDHYKNPVILKGDDLKTLSLTAVFNNQDLPDVLDEIDLVLNLTHAYKNDTIVIRKVSEQ